MFVPTSAACEVAHCTKHLVFQSKVLGRGWVERLQISLIVTVIIKLKLYLRIKISLSSLELYLCALAMQTHQDQAFCNALVNVFVLFQKRQEHLQELLGSCRWVHGLENCSLQQTKLYSLLIRSVTGKDTQSFCTCHQLSSPGVAREDWRKRSSMSFPFFVRKQALRDSYRFWGGCLQQIHKQLLRASNWAKHLTDEKKYKMAPGGCGLCMHLVLMRLPFALELAIVSEVLKEAEA